MARTSLRPTGSGRRRVALFQIAATLTIGIAANGCKDDKKISPPPPASEYLEPASPANVLANLKTAYTRRNESEYAKLLTPDFVFRFNPADVANPENPTPVQWSREDELDAARDLFASARVDTIFLAWSLGQVEPTDSIPGGRRVRADQIDLSVYTRNENNELLILQVRGAYQDFYLREDASITLPGGAHPWAIARWDDSPIGGKVEDMSWGRIKRFFRQP